MQQEAPGQDPRASAAWIYAAVWAVAAVVAIVLDSESQAGERPIAWRIGFYAKWAGLGGATSWGLREWLHRRARPRRRLVAGVLAMCALGALGWAVTDAALSHYAFGFRRRAAPSVGDAGSYLLFLLFILLAWAAAELAVDFRRRWAHADALAARAQLETLRHQLSPHFLFNSLNTISALIGIDPDAAQDALVDLSDLLRASLGRSGSVEQTVGAELDRVDLFVRVQRARFGDDLVVRRTVDPRARAVALPSFLLQPLIENAIEHGMKGARRPLEIEISAATGPGGALRLDVSNTGELRSPIRERIGLGSVRARLEAIYPGAHALRLHQRDARVHVEIRIDDPARAHRR